MVRWIGGGMGGGRCGIRHVCLGWKDDWKVIMALKESLAEWVIQEQGILK